MDAYVIFILCVTIVTIIIIVCLIRKKKIIKLADSDIANVFKVKNHIYFSGDVEREGIDKLVEQIALIKNKKKPVYLHINSNGGSLTEGFRIMDVIENAAAKIYTIVEGVAFSSASLMFLAGKKRFMTKNSSVMIHQLSDNFSGGTYEQIKENQVNNTFLMKKLYDVYHKKSNGTMKKRTIKKILKKDIYWDYVQCKKKNIVDDLLTNNIYNK